MFLPHDSVRQHGFKRWRASFTRIEGRFGRYCSWMQVPIILGPQSERQDLFVRSEQALSRRMSRAHAYGPRQRRSCGSTSKGAEAVRGKMEDPPRDMTVNKRSCKMFPLRCKKAPPLMRKCTPSHWLRLILICPRYQCSRRSRREIHPLQTDRRQRRRRESEYSHAFHGHVMNEVLAVDRADRTGAAMSRKRVGTSASGRFAANAMLRLEVAE